MLKKIKISEQSKIFTLFILEDIFRLLAVSLFFILIFEGILPGVITDRINITYLLLASIFIYLSLTKLSAIISIDTEKNNKKNRWLIPTISIFFVLLMIQSLYKFPVGQITILGIGLAAIAYLFYREFLSE